VCVKQLGWWFFLRDPAVFGNNLGDEVCISTPWGGAGPRRHEGPWTNFRRASKGKLKDGGSFQRPWVSVFWAAKQAAMKTANAIPPNATKRGGCVRDKPFAGIVTFRSR